MRRAIISSDGRLSLGAQAHQAGYVPGTLVDVLVTRAGTLIVSLAEADHEAVDLDLSRLPPGRARTALTERHAR